MVPLHSEKLRDFAPTSAQAPKVAGFLNHLRFVAMNCRAKPRADLFEACALLRVSRDATQHPYAEALMRCLPEALGKPVKTFAPGVVELSFDERWLLQIGRAAAEDDETSLAFLLRSRVAPQHRRMIGFLIRQITDGFPTV